MVSHSLASVLLGALSGVAVCGNVEAAPAIQRSGIANTAPVPAYGVRWKLIADEVNDYLAPCERLGLSQGLSAADFDSISPFGRIRQCNVLQQNNGETKITYQGEPGFSLTGSNGNVFAEIPKHYVARYQADGYEYRYVSEKRLPGFAVDPAFVEDGKELEAIYVSAYEAYIGDGKMMSITGVYPTANCTRPEYRAYARAHGQGYGILDIRTLNMLQNLFLVEYANRDSQAALGRGWGKIHQPLRGSLRCTLAENGVNRIVVDDWSRSRAQRLFVGSAIQMVDYGDQRTVLVTGRTITSVKTDTPSGGRTAVHFDGDPINTTTSMMLGGAAQKSGWSDTLSTPSGRTDDNGGGPDATYRNAVRYRYMENLWGNVWHFIDGLNLSKGASYTCDNMRDYSSGITSAYRAVAVEQQTQTDNGTVGGDREIHYMKDLVFDPLHPFLALPKDYVNQGQTSVPHAQVSPRLGSDTLRHSNFGDYYYLDTRATCYVHGGGFDHYWRCGLFTMRGWASDRAKWYLYGARMIYKPI